MSTGQPLSSIAYLCGFRDYNYFARVFRQRFGYSPGEVQNNPMVPVLGGAAVVVGRAAVRVAERLAGS